MGPTSAICQTQAIWEYTSVKACEVPQFSLEALTRTWNLNSAQCMQTNAEAILDFKIVSQVDLDF